MSAQDAEKAGLVSKVFPVNELVSTLITDNRVSVMIYVLVVSVCSMCSLLLYTLLYTEKYANTHMHAHTHTHTHTHTHKGLYKMNHLACLAYKMCQEEVQTQICCNIILLNTTGEVNCVYMST